MTKKYKFKDNSVVPYDPNFSHMEVRNEVLYFVLSSGKAFITKFMNVLDLEKYLKFGLVVEI